MLPIFRARRRALRRLAARLLPLALLLAPTLAAAQDRERILAGPIFGAQAGGVIPIADYEETLDPGVHASVLVEAWPWRQLGLRADFGYGRLSRQADQFRDVLSGYLRYVYGEGGVLVALRDPARGAAPYLVGGGGAYNVKSRDEVDLGPVLGRDVRTGTTTRPGLHAGAGLRIPAGAIAFALEARVVHVLADGPDLTTVPLTIGIRF